MPPSSKQAATAGADSGEVAPPERCDVCTKKDGFQGMKLLRCRECGVCVHETCYGLTVSSSADAAVSSASVASSWICNACDAVGKTVVVSRKGHRPIKTMTQTARPTDCALCPVIDGEHVAPGVHPWHAMHKLYDTHGPEGHQLVLKADRKRNLPERLGWVHSACAYGIGSSRLAKGCVFGCMADGSHDGDGNSDADDDDEEGISSDEEPFDTRVEESEWIGATKTKGNHGSGGSSPRKKKKKSEDGDEVDDTHAVHHFVICGKEHGQDTFWTNRIKECRELRCFLCGNAHCPPTHFPLQCCANEEGEFEEHTKRHDDKDPCYTAMHVGCARGWDERYPAQVKRVFFFPGAPGADGSLQPVSEMYCSRHAEVLFDNAPQRKKQTQEQFKPRQQASRSTSALSRSSGGTDAPVPLRRASASTKIRPTGSVPVPTAAAGARASRAAAAPAPAPAKDWFEDIRDDVVKIIKRTQARGGEVSEATKRVKAHWKDPEQRAKMGMNKKEFNAVWERVKDAVNEMPELQPNTDTSSDTRSTTGSIPRKKKADASAAEKVNPWASIWEPGGKTFEFGDWDTIEFVADSETGNNKQ